MEGKICFYLYLVNGKFGVSEAIQEIISQTKSKI